MGRRRREAPQPTAAAIYPSHKITDLCLLAGGRVGSVRQTDGGRSPGNCLSRKNMVFASCLYRAHEGRKEGRKEGARWGQPLICNPSVASEPEKEKKEKEKEKS